MRKICIFTGTRADYGLLKPLIDEVSSHSKLHLQLLVSGMHLSSEFGLTVRQIEEDGLAPDEKVEVLLSSDTPVGISKSMGLGLIGYAEALERLDPDLLVVLGDRFEAFCAAAAAMIARLPLAHIHGGEATHGLIDEPIRHSITKMSHLHFTSTEEYRRRVIQLGETPDRVFNVGALGIENIKKIKLLSLKELEQELDFRLGNKSIMVTLHPVTLESGSTQNYCYQILEALDRILDVNILFTKANADTEGRIINEMIDKYQAANPHRSKVFTSLGQVRYLSALRHVDLVLGNSSSGIIEAPSLKTPTVNIGDRQAGRIRAASVIDCMPEQTSIEEAVTRAFSPEFREVIKNTVNPYDQEKVAARITNIRYPDLTLVKY